MQNSGAKLAELEASNKGALQELADFKAESRELRNQDLTVKRMEAQLGQLKAQLQSKVRLLPLSHTAVWPCAAAVHSCNASFAGHGSLLSELVLICMLYMT